MAQKKQTLFEQLTSEEAVEKYTDLKSSRGSIVIKATIVLITLAVSTVFFSLHISERSGDIRLMNILPGQIWSSQTIESEFNFPVYKDDYVYQSEIDSARKKARLVFSFKSNAEKLAISKLDTLISDFKKAYNQKKALEKNSEETEQMPEEEYYFDTQFILPPAQLNTIQSHIKKFFSVVYDQGFVNIATEDIKANKIQVNLNNKDQIIVSKQFLLDSSSFITKAEDYFKLKVPDNLRTITLDLVLKLMLPNYIYSEEETQISKDLAESSIPRTKGMVRAGDIVVAKGQKITPEILLKLRSYAKSSFMRSETGYSAWLFLGSFGHAFAILLILYIYLFNLRKRIYFDNFKFGILNACMILTGLMSWISLQVGTRLPVEFIVLLPSLSMLIAIVFDSRTAFYSTVTMAFVVAGIRGYDYDLGVGMLLAGSFAAYTVRDIQSRTQVFKSMLFIFSGFLITIVSFAFVRSADFMPTVYQLIFALINSALAPFFTFGLLFILERVSNITTDLRLQEYNSLSHPLLVKLSEYAPGTYQHTMSVALLAEKCAIAIGANSLLTRVGSLYHDIGKVAKPEYFVENQQNIDNKHDLLSPKKSAEAIRNHVLEGMKLAREYKIPQRIIDFIPMHHGTSLIKHFYAKALEEGDRKSVNEKDFRYPGPKPNSKETAIVMICDPAEALSRLENKSEEDLETAISFMIQERIGDGQFDDCKLTMYDLKLIRETILKNLHGISHKRVEYKKIPGDKK
jgi:putative nucleotidyltransferase with HDIG domain